MRQAYDGRRPVARVKASFKELRRERGDEAEVAAEPWKLVRQRHGILGWWLDLSAPPPAPADASLSERERIRRAELSGYVTFAVLALGLLMLPNALQNRPTLISTGVIVLAGIAAGWLNRTNRTLTAAVLLVGVLFLTIGGAMATSPNLDLVWMPALDFFAVPVVLAGLLISRRAPFVAAVVGAAAVVALVTLKPRDPGLTAAVAHLGAFHFMLRPMLLQAVMALIAWLWAGSVAHAIARADRAEEVAAMEHELAAQKDQLDIGIQDLLETHVRVANGDFSARAHTSQDNLLWQIAVSLNNLLARLGNFAQVDARLQRTETEIDRLAAAMENARMGRGAIWPAPGGTRVDFLLRLLTAGSPTRGQGTGRLGASANAARATAGPARPASVPPGTTPAPSPGLASGVRAMPNGMAGRPAAGAGANPAAGWPGAPTGATGAPTPNWATSGALPFAAPFMSGNGQNPRGWPNVAMSGRGAQNGHNGQHSHDTQHGHNGHAGYGPARMPMPHQGNVARAAEEWRSLSARALWAAAHDPHGRDAQSGAHGHDGDVGPYGDRGRPAEHGAHGDGGPPPAAARQWPSDPLPTLPPSPWRSTTELPWDGAADWTPEPLDTEHGLSENGLASDPAIELTMPRGTTGVPETGATGTPRADGAPLGDDDEPWPDWPAILRRWSERPAPPDPTEEV